MQRALREHYRARCPCPVCRERRWEHGEASLLFEKPAAEDVFVFSRDIQEPKDDTR